MDNVGRYTEGQLGLFHVKIAGARMITNEHWGRANSKSPWSLWKINALLGRKMITAGWKSKSLPPFRPALELVLTMSLPANILDAFRIHCPVTTIEDWLSSSPSREHVREVALKVLTESCSERRVSRLRSRTDVPRDIPLENITLFNRDVLFLRILQYAIRRGDIGMVINVLVYWMIMFRGTGNLQDAKVRGCSLSDADDVKANAGQIAVSAEVLVLRHLVRVCPYIPRLVPRS